MFRLGRFLLAAEPLVKCEIVGKIAVLKLNRPKALNALNSEIVTELAENLKKVEANPAVGCIVVTGEGIHPPFAIAVSCQTDSCFIYLY